MCVCVCVNVTMSKSWTTTGHLIEATDHCLDRAVGGPLILDNTIYNIANAHTLVQRKKEKRRRVDARMKSTRQSKCGRKFLTKYNIKQKERKGIHIIRTLKRTCAATVSCWASCVGRWTRAPSVMLLKDMSPKSWREGYGTFPIS